MQFAYGLGSGDEVFGLAGGAFLLYATHCCRFVQLVVLGGVLVEDCKKMWGFESFSRKKVLGYEALPVGTAGCF